MKPLLPTLMLIMLPGLALAQYTGPGSQPQATTATAAANAADDTLVILEGKLISQINVGHFERSGGQRATSTGSAGADRRIARVVGGGKQSVADTG